MTSRKREVGRTPWVRWFLGAVALLAALTVATARRCRATESTASRDGAAIAPRARALAQYQLAGWSSPSVHRARVAALRAENPEWDLMARTFLALSLADMALRRPQEAERFLASLDRIIDETVAIEQASGQSWFLLPYARDRPFLGAGDRSLFVDGEIALMLGVRQLVRPRRDYALPLDERARMVERAMRAGPTLSGESYPDECWTFCNTTALAALRVVDAVTGRDHASLSRAWVAVARRRLLDPVTGLLVSSYTYDGRTKDGPEGSTLWMSARNLLLIDEAFARDQYARARRELGGELLGFGYAREWPRSGGGRVDIDSGPIVPWLEASPSSSGFAVLGATAFDDAPFLRSLLASLELTAFPVEERGMLHFEASNGVGDAVLLSGLVFGPVWARVRARTEPAQAGTVDAMKGE